MNDHGKKIDPQWFAAACQQLRLLGFHQAEFVEAQQVIQLTARNLYLQPGLDGNFYSLIQQVGRVHSSQCAGLLALNRAHWQYRFCAIASEHDLVTLGISLGPIKYENLGSLAEQTEYLAQAATEAAAEIPELQNSLSLTLEAALAGAMIPAQPYCAQTRMHQVMREFVQREMGLQPGRRLLLVYGRSGIGKRTTLSQVLPSLGWTPILPAHCAGLAAFSLVDRLRTISQQLAKGRHVALVIPDILSQSIIPGRDSYDQVGLLLYEISASLPVILLSSSEAQYSHATAAIELKEELKPVIGRILDSHFPGAIPHELPQKEEKDLADPLYTLRWLSTRREEFPRQVKKSLRTIKSAIEDEFCDHDHVLDNFLGYLKSLEDFPAASDQPTRNGVFLFAGAPGTGKTLLVKKLAKALGVGLVMVAANEEANAAEFFRSRLFGSAAGYVGYREAARLDALRPGTDTEWGDVLLIDEFEKLSETSRNLFLSILAGETIESSKQSLRLRKNIIILTTNHAVRQLSRGRMGFATGPALKEELKEFYLKDNFFARELLSRIQMVVQFNPISDQTHLVSRAIEKCLGGFLQGETRFKLIWNAAEIAAALGAMHQNEFETLGLRRVEPIIRETILAPLSRLLEEGASVAQITVQSDGRIQVRQAEMPPPVAITAFSQPSAQKGELCH